MRLPRKRQGGLDAEESTVSVEEDALTIEEILETSHSKPLSIAPVREWKWRLSFPRERQMNFL